MPSYIMAAQRVRGVAGAALGAQTPVFRPTRQVASARAAKIPALSSYGVRLTNGAQLVSAHALSHNFCSEVAMSVQIICFVQLAVRYPNSCMDRHFFVAHARSSVAHMVTSPRVRLLLSRYLMQQCGALVSLAATSEPDRLLSKTDYRAAILHCLA